MIPHFVAVLHEKFVGLFLEILKWKNNLPKRKVPFSWSELALENSYCINYASSCSYVKETQHTQC